jgi:catechol 2,3-dioxygenase-like lactoylglutathione lyase family enzyme
MGSPAETLLSVTVEGIAGFAGVTGQPKGQHYLPDMILAIQTSPTEISPIQKRSQMPFVDRNSLFPILPLTVGIETPLIIGIFLGLRGPIVVFQPCSRVDLGNMVPAVEKVSAITFQVTNMQVSVRFYRDVLGMELIYGGEDSYFSSLQANEAESAILNLEKGHPCERWGRLILHVTDVDAFWTRLKEKGFDPERPRDGAWGERYFHMPDPDGHELSFARPLR